MHYTHCRPVWWSPAAANGLLVHKQKLFSPDTPLSDCNPARCRHTWLLTGMGDGTLNGLVLFFPTFQSIKVNLDTTLNAL